MICEHVDGFFFIYAKSLSHLISMQIFKIAISTCDHYVDCSACVSSHDPKNCGWCGFCSTQSECSEQGGSSTWQQANCPPAIYGVSSFFFSVPCYSGCTVQVKHPSCISLFLCVCWHCGFRLWTWFSITRKRSVCFCLYCKSLAEVIWRCISRHG